MIQANDPAGIADVAMPALRATGFDGNFGFDGWRQYLLAIITSEM